jgi:Inhibitor of growth proteins N-terminal histone-binding
MVEKGTLMDLAERRRLGEDLEKNLQESLKISKAKLFLANQAYDSVDKYIRRLDNDMNRFHISLTRHQMDKSGNAILF